MALLRRLLETVSAQSSEYFEQLPLVKVASRCGCGCPTIDFAVAGRSAPLNSPSVILSEAEGVSPEGTQFGVIQHAREGLLSELEVYAIDREGPFTLPDIEDLRFTGVP